MLIASLRQKILDRAIRGLLVEQRPEEGTAEELYQQIQAEKQRLIAEGAIKKEKPLPPIAESEIPFEIPETWKWVRLGELFSFINGDRGKNYPAKNTLHKEGIPFISAVNIRDRSIPTEGLLYVSSEQFNKLRSGHLKKEDLVVCIRGSLGKFCIYPFEEGAIASSLVILREVCLGYKSFVAVYLDSFFFHEGIKASQNGTAQPNLSAGDLSKFSLPLPPLAEQKRIVQKVESLFSKLDIIAESKNRVNAIQAALKKRILNQAIQGKLVPQCPEEGTAVELYQQIQTEKKRLIAEGKIKKEKPLPSIEEKDIPFDIPETWKWVYLGEIFAHNTGKAQNASAETKNGVLRKFITTSNLYWDSFDFTTVKEMLFSESELAKCSVQKGDLLVCEGGDVGRSAIWPYEESMCIQNHIHKLRAYVDVEPRFFYYVLYFLKNTGNLTGRGVGIKGLSSGVLHTILCPLPPLAEQKRIVDKIEHLLNLFCKYL